MTGVRETATVRQLPILLEIRERQQLGPEAGPALEQQV